MRLLRNVKANTNEAENSVENGKNRTKTGQSAAKTSAKCWESRVKIRPGVRNGLFYVRLFEGSREAWICCDSSNRITAAARARDHWVRMKAIGLPALLSELSPDPLPERCGTVGEAIAAASKLSTVRPISFLGYVKRLRQVAGEIAGVKRPRKMTSWNSPEADQWRAEVDAVRLDRLNKEAVNKWRAEKIAASSKDPLARRSAIVTADSAIRLARAVFAQDILAAGLGKVVRLPDPLPFAGVSYGKSHRRFISPVDPAQLFAAARADLETKHPQQFLAFCLCLLAGLRRSEADLLTWTQVKLDQGTLDIQATEFFQPKTEEATREIELDAVAVDILRRAKADKPDPIFVLKGAPYRKQFSAAPLYRADAAPYFTWVSLAEWLRGKGVNDPKPIHVLRKLAGSLIFQAHGIEQARGFLGHGDVSTTSRSYLAKTKRVIVSIAPPSDEVSEARATAKGGIK
jgi:integrase